MASAALAHSSGRRDGLGEYPFSPANSRCPRGADLVWQRLDEVNGDGVFLTSNFTPFKAETPRNDSWNEQQAMMSTVDYLAQFDNTSRNSDLELAIALQQQEFERQPQRFQAPPPQQQQQQ
ncbi:uncharacterized protein [Miscanthus floridulus]|uniref:uncharacterized protein n=1 Tax=Miscanthus floridulus TaxID=154761 RepID=UPI00345A9967